jgi:hypothetical protein
MRKLILVLFVLLLPTIVMAQSSSIAEIFYPSYGHAEHFNSDNEFLGINGSSADGITWDQLTAGQVTTMSIVTSVGNFWGVGDFYNLSMWADWNGNRAFDEAERIFSFSEEYIEAGISTVTFQTLVPLDAMVDGTTWLRARFDWYGDGALEPSGFAYSGEVEDYQVSVSQGIEPVPEPATLTLMAIGLASTAYAARRKKRKV